jgi:hypothetical protein
VEWLRIERSREGLDLRRIDDMGCADEALADVEILEIEAATSPLEVQPPSSGPVAQIRSLEARIGPTPAHAGVSDQLLA